jgi:hypothetical protein
MTPRLVSLTAVAGMVGLLGSSNALAEFEPIKGVTLGGTIAVDAIYAKDFSAQGYANDQMSDFFINYVELRLNAKLNEWVNGQLSLLYEENYDGSELTAFGVDTALITVGNTKVNPFYVQVGQGDVGISSFETHMISDPLTLTIGEMYEDYLLLGFESHGAYGGFFIFNGDTELHNGSDTIENHFGGKIGFSQETERMNYDVGIGYVSSIADSGTLTGALEAKNGNMIVGSDFIDGITAHAKFDIAGFDVIGEYVAALDSFDTNILAFGNSGAQPSVWNFEVGYTHEISGKEATFALGYQQTSEAVALGFPESRLSFGVSVGIVKNTTLSFEWAHDEDYDISDGGTGKKGDKALLQLAVDF